jgi:hypothetical protein
MRAPEPSFSRTINVRGTPNPWVQAILDYAFCGFARQWPSAPDPARWEKSQNRRLAPADPLECGGLGLFFDAVLCLTWGRDLDTLTPCRAPCEWNILGPKEPSPCSITWPVDITRSNPRRPTKHAHSSNSNLRFDPFPPPLTSPLGKIMRAFLNATAFLIWAATYVFAQPSSAVLWGSERVQFSLPDTKPYWAWIILPAEDGTTNAGSFKKTVDSIFRSEPGARIEHVCLGSVNRDAALQKEVIGRLKDTVVLRRYPTRHDADGRMYVDGTANPLSVQMCQ